MQNASINFPFNVHNNYFPFEKNNKDNIFDFCVWSILI